MTKFDQVVKNPLSPVEHPGGLGMNCELFELGVEQFVVSRHGSENIRSSEMLIVLRAGCVPSELIVPLCNTYDVVVRSPL